MEKFLFRIAKQWIAGDSMQQALESARLANKKGMDAIINRLGEHIKTKSQVEKTVKEYRENKEEVLNIIIDYVQKNKLKR